MVQVLLFQHVLSFCLVNTGAQKAYGFVEYWKKGLHYPENVL